VVTAAPAPGVYVGSIRHRRFTPRPHDFQYQLFMVLLDVDGVEQAMAASRLTSYNRWNWASFHDRDHVGDPSQPLRARITASAKASGLLLPDGPILLLTHLRYAGYVFNPISLFYCFDRNHALRAVLADVRNTYGGRRFYWLQPADAAAHRFRAVADKTLYVSPFMEPGVGYEFVLTPPGTTLVAHMNVMRQAPEGSGDAAGRERRILDATLSLERRPWTAVNIRRALLRFPWMTAQVTAAIHFEALRLRLKGLPVVPPPLEPEPCDR
jgi:DUF1365 family protein